MTFIFTISGKRGAVGPGDATEIRRLGDGAGEEQGVLRAKGGGY